MGLYPGELISKLGNACSFVLSVVLAKLQSLHNKATLSRGKYCHPAEGGLLYMYIGGGGGGGAYNWMVSWGAYN